LKPSVLELVPQLLGALVLVSLFIERFIEVFVAVWRKPNTELLGTEVNLLEKTKLEQGPEYRHTGNQGSSVNELLEGALIRQAEYRAGTQRFALSLGLLLGIVVAASGFSFLDNLVQKPEINKINVIKAAENQPQGDTGKAAESKGTRIALFDLMDVLLTGAVLAAGSDPIHKILTVFTTFLDSTKKKVETKTP